jgi:hypothetical protein
MTKRRGAVHQLQSRHLTTLHLDVGFNAMISIGAMAQGRRRIAPILGGRFDGERLRGVVQPGGADWVVNRPDGVMVIDVRITLVTHDGVPVYCTYQGLFRAETEAMTRFNRGELLREEEYSLRTVTRFESGAVGYAWLNDLLTIGIGRQTVNGPFYEIFEIQ